MSPRLRVVAFKLEVFQVTSPHLDCARHKHRRQGSCSAALWHKPSAPNLTEILSNAAASHHAKELEHMPAGSHLHLQAAVRGRINEVAVHLGESCATEATGADKLAELC